VIRPTVLHADGSVDAIFDEMQHTGTVLEAQILWARNIDGSENRDMLLLPCPDGCGAVSSHPRGSTTDLVPEMFYRKDSL
jgi:hypothetical protein